LREPLDPEILQKIDRLRQTSDAYLNRALVLYNVNPHE
jgi:hypothetical protein